MRSWLLLLSLLLLLLGAGCDSSSERLVVDPAPPPANPPQLQISVHTLDADGPEAVVAQQVTDIDRFVLRIAGRPDQALTPDDFGDNFTIDVDDIPSGVVPITLLAQNSDSTTLAHYQTDVTVPGQLVVHLARFEIGDVSPDQDGPLDVWVQQSSFPVIGAPNLTETIWGADVSLPDGTPRSPYDTIGLHRVVGPNPIPGRVLVYLPGASANASLYTNLEDRDFRLFLANRGYDIYSLDYRTHFIPPFQEPGIELPPLVTGDLRFTIHWDSATFVSDAAMAIKQAKAISGADKVFLSGFSSGGQIAYFYACSDQLGGLGQDQLRGLISLDGGPWQISGPAPLNTLDMATARAALDGGDTPANRAVLAQFGATPDEGYYSNSLGTPDEGFVSGLVAYLFDQDAPSPVAGYASAADYLIFRMQTQWGVNGVGDGQFTNVQRGYNTLPMLLVFAVLATDGYWPVIQDLEDSVLSNRSGPLDGPFIVPVAPDDEYLANLPRITIPILAIGGTGLDSFVGTPLSWKFAALGLTSSTDTQRLLVEHFGHIDLLCGTRVTEQVSTPLLNWLQSR